MNRSTAAALALLMTFGIFAHARADPLADEMRTLSIRQEFC